MLLVDKPAGITSHDVVGAVRRAARTRRVGHAGTLDPFATGLLVVAVGHATRLLAYVDGEPKVYDATIRFGIATDTDDATGTTIASGPLPDPLWLHDPRATARIAAERTLTGRIAQIPPAYSAKHVAGQRAYDRARRGEIVNLAPVDVHVHEWMWQSATDDSLTTRIRCGGGTYVRALARDLGVALGTVAHCASLRRVASGAAHVDGAVPFPALAPGSIADGAVPLTPSVALLGNIARQSVADDELDALRQGRRLRATTSGVRVALLRNDDVVAIAERAADDWWQPRVVLLGSAA
jgi:tRNA pseudouridine55 synthase